MKLFTITEQQEHFLQKYLHHNFHEPKYSWHLLDKTYVTISATVSIKPTSKNTWKLQVQHASLTQTKNKHQNRHNSLPTPPTKAKPIPQERPFSPRHPTPKTKVLPLSKTQKSKLQFRHRSHTIQTNLGGVSGTGTTSMGVFGGATCLSIGGEEQLKTQAHAVHSPVKLGLKIGASGAVFMAVEGYCDGVRVAMGGCNGRWRW